MSLPPGVSQSQIDSFYGFSEGGADSLPNRQECFLCRRMIQQCPDFERWFIEDESGWVPTHYSDFTDAFQTEAGWVCSTDCWDDHAIEAGPHASDCNVWVKEPCSCVTGKEPKLFLVGGAA